MQAIPIGNAQVIHTGSGQGQGDAWIMDALNNMQAQQRQTAIEQQRQEDEARQLGQANAGIYGKRLSPDLTPEQLTQAQTDYASQNPDSADYLKPFTTPVPQGPGAQLKRTVGEWQNAIMPQFLQTLQTNPEKVDPQLFMTFYPYLSSGDKNMDPGIVKLITDRYILANQDKLPPDLVQQTKIAGKVVQSPQEVAQQGVEKRGQDLGLQGKKYEADASAGATRYGVDAKKDVYAAEAGMLTNKGDMYGTRADMNENEAGNDQINNHPAVQALQNKITMAQKDRDRDAAAAGNGKLPPAERQAASQRAQDADANIRYYQDNLQQTKIKMRKSLGIDEMNDAEEPSANSGGASTPAAPSAPEGGYLNLGRPGVPPQPTNTGPQIHDMRGSNMPRTPQVGAPSGTVPRSPAASTAPTQPLAALAQQLAASGQIDQAKKTMTRAAAQQLKASGVDVAGYTITP